ncbi:unnamed protein product, partial [Urochloa humidicola]
LIDPTLAAALLSLSPSTGGRQHGAAAPSGAPEICCDGAMAAHPDLGRRWARAMTAHRGAVGSRTTSLGDMGARPHALTP